MNDVEYKKILWAWFLKRAQAHDIYGGFRDLDKYEARHLRLCGIDLNKSGSPFVGSVDQFAGTLDPDDRVDAVTVSSWVCKCGKYGDGSPKHQRGLELGISGRAVLEQIIREVIKEAEK